MLVELSEVERKKLTAFVKKHGIKKASEKLLVNRGTITAAIVGLKVQAGTALVIKTKLVE